MKTTLSKDDRIVLDCLLSRLAGSLDGAVDFWTVVCVGQFPPGPRAFILQRSETLRALVVVVRLLLAEIQLDSFKLSDDLLQRMYAACQELQEAFLILAQFQSVSLEQLRSATEAVKAVYEDLRQAVRQLGQA